jgi:hypothetical protein
LTSSTTARALEEGDSRFFDGFFSSIFASRRLDVSSGNQLLGDEE